MNSAAWPFGALRPFGYDVVVIDPPWDFENYSDAGTKKGADPHYDVMALADIKALPVGHLARQDAIVLLWSTGAILPQALDVLNAWGARYLSQIIWRKVTKNGKVRLGTGYRVRSCHEPILLASFGGRQRHAAFPSIFDGLARSIPASPKSSTAWSSTGRPTWTGATCSVGRAVPASMAGVTGTGSSIGWRTTPMALRRNAAAKPRRPANRKDDPTK